MAARLVGTWEEEGGGQQPGWQQGCVELAGGEEEGGWQQPGWQQGCEELVGVGEEEGGGQQPWWQRGCGDLGGERGGRDIICLVSNL